MIIIVLSVPLLFYIKNYIDRRSLGIITFLITLLHFFLYLTDNDLNFSSISSDIVSRNFIQAGYVALILFIPLFMTSSDKAKKKLGWEAKITFKEMVYEMMENDINIAKRDSLVKKHGFKAPDFNE